MTNNPSRSPNSRFELNLTEFWSAHLGLTLVTISLSVILFVITPLREAGLPGRLFFETVVVALMIFGSLAIRQSRLAKAFSIAIVIVSAVVLGAGRVHPTRVLHLWGSALVIVTLLLFARIVLLVMFDEGPVTWSRIQGGLCVYLLIAKLTYFSFATLTTVGSTIVPVDPFARSLTIAEAIVGQLFPATLIGALVAMAMQSRTRS